MRQIERVVAAALAGVVVSSAAAQDAVQWRVEDGGNGHWYQGITVPSGLTWDTASTEATVRGGNLASLELDGESEWVFQTVGSRADLWILQTPSNGGLWFGPWVGGVQEPGSREPAGGWYWLSGDEVTEDWPGGFLPNNACGGSSDEDRLHFWFIGGPGNGWNDLPSDPTCGSDPRGFIIEWSADCNDDGIVDYGQIQDGTFADTDGNGVPDCCDADEQCDPCTGDLNGDGVVGPPDLGILLAVWGTDGGDIAGADINGDGTVNASDLGPLLGAWGVCP